MLTGSEKWTKDSHNAINNRLKKGATWAQVFGTDIYADEVFMAYYHANMLNSWLSRPAASATCPSM